ncbi:hypothetical protein ANK1_4213 [plant metagenome]|uniref:Uncharacterized protein n=1 Tax=plant metagenome TaxID=1297885 RepID=A0A484SFN7_9ZZZZ
MIYLRFLPANPICYTHCYTHRYWIPAEHGPKNARASDQAAQQRVAPAKCGKCGAIDIARALRAGSRARQRAAETRSASHHLGGCLRPSGNLLSSWSRRAEEPPSESALPVRRQAAVQGRNNVPLPIGSATTEQC